MELSDFKVVFDGPRDEKAVRYHFPSHWVVQYLFTIEKDGEYVDVFVDFDSTLPTDFRAWRPYIHWLQNGLRFSRSTNEDSYSRDRGADLYFQVAKRYFQDMWWVCFQDQRRHYSGAVSNAAAAVQPYLKEK